MCLFSYNGVLATNLLKAAIIPAEIDRLVYQLYGLIYNEVLIIDPTPPFTREEYEQEEK